ncbi:hypothetical protein [uncultured Methanobrevibacter sp.]|uniref:hypothetical protein n=1 Tax=uncultured Methanobrevibacter sp. TaxID=253161 RepID=UPI0025FC10D1|nr:hypothetical protein [uncultured Methanobrevibacter sp.]
MGFIDNFKEWSTLKKFTFIVIVCCICLIIVSVLGGVLYQDQNTQTTTNSNSSANDSNQVYTDGTYKVGSDLPEGTYKFTQTSSDGGFVERSALMDTLSNSKEEYKATNEKDETVYITVEDGENLKVEGGEVVLV